MVLLAGLLVSLLGGCTSLEGWAIRQQFVDHDYQQTIRPHLQDSYERKAAEPAPAGVPLPAPADLDRG